MSKLWSAIRSGEEWALSRLEELVEAACGHVLRSCPWAESERESLAAQVMSSVWEFAREREEPPRNLREFLKWRARSVLKNVVREWERQSRHKPISAGVELPGVGWVDLDEPIMKELSEAFEVCRSRLRPAYASAWEARYSKGLGVRETSDLLDTSPRTIAVHLHRAKLQLRECLEAKGVLS